MQYQILSGEETKDNYKVLLNNIQYWLITKNLSENWQSVSYIYNIELTKLNNEINVNMGPRALMNLIDQNRGKFWNFILKENNF